jgi:hypothetical protein
VTQAARAAGHEVAALRPLSVDGRVIAAWPSFALTGAYELLMRQVRPRRSAELPICASSAGAGCCRLAAQNEVFCRSGEPAFSLPFSQTRPVCAEAGELDSCWAERLRAAGR